MHIVIGSGNSRVVHTLPGGGFMKAASTKEPKEYNKLHGVVCSLLNIPKP